MNTARTWGALSCLLLVVKMVMLLVSMFRPESWSQVPELSVPVGIVGLAFVGSSLFLSARDVLVGHLSTACLALVTGWSAASSLIVGDYGTWSVIALTTSVLLLISSLLAARGRRGALRKELA